MAKSLAELSAQVHSSESSHELALPPVHQWNPELSGDMDLLVKTNGQWVHEGQVIERAALVRLFCSILKREQDDYFLVTPVEKWRIQVETFPLFYNELIVDTRDGYRELRLRGHCPREVTIGEANPLWVEQNNQGPLPVVAVRDQLNGVISRSVYYQLADLAEQDGSAVWVSSQGLRFSLLER